VTRKKSDPRSDHEPTLVKPDAFDANKFEKQLEKVEDAIPESVARFPKGDRTGSRLLKRIRSVIRKLESFYKALDPVFHSDILDPSRPDVAGEVFATKLEKAERVAMAELPRFWGSGVYAIYYSGKHPAYANIANKASPIYVGKAEPLVPDAKTSEEQGRQLHARLSFHLKNIRTVEKYASEHPELESQGVRLIRAEDFSCRYLVLSSAHAGAVEHILINAHSPPWNSVCDGFGKHGDDSSTRKNTRSEWDTLHPGRPWAMTTDTKPNPLSPLEIQELVLKHTAKG
jgi:hypothetical protein